MTKNQENPETVQRFNVLHRLLHIVVFVSFIILAITGFSLSFAHNGFARFLTSILGGADGIGGIHRFFATFFYIGVLIHLLWLIFYKLGLKGRLTGPNTMTPGKKDISDIYQNLRYIFGRGTPPLFNRFSYLQKLDYWAVMLGMQSMGITGLIMWYPEFFTSFLPGYAVNIAFHFHFHEAVLAVLYIGFVHMTDTHLDPEVFPIEKSIFNGKKQSGLYTSEQQLE
ncbi:cytochrome b subunit of formate dehydrogenase [Desulfosalsimonas propionicica]|uniref:Cytochrome b subunit of formate dehydrogenase n=1 Tax=Desulfosalsimonas propionicica TaxID=332175 RepID=A0A7W0CBV4_9BACT|nr:cytochrome b/b6 domain-containing protein [Desulfosalsimonas propionicica]MBA2882792.1 cytochrome b subunit of formate dehydrogenase [Desulfosalsimonas propionicica]